jgi:hypothetical protein
LVGHEFAKRWRSDGNQDRGDGSDAHQLDQREAASRTKARHGASYGVGLQRVLSQGQSPPVPAGGGAS